MPNNWEYIKVGDQLYIHDEDNNRLYFVVQDKLIEVKEIKSSKDVTND